MKPKIIPKDELTQEIFLRLLGFEQAAWSLALGWVCFMG
jgi:hypothetical protein